VSCFPPSKLQDPAFIRALIKAGIQGEVERAREGILRLGASGHLDAAAVARGLAKLDRLTVPPDAETPARRAGRKRRGPS
jgi:hypothetical protein